MKTRIIAAAMVLLVACGTSRNQDPAKPQTLKQMGSVDQLLAPVALYPDQLIAQILISAQNPPKVTELDAWLKANQTLQGSQLQDAALKAGFDPSFIALTLFPTVVARMADQISWTTLVGQAFTSDRNSVFDAIQRLRKQAQEVGTLKTTAQQQVSTTTTSTGTNVIVIQPANPQVVYVPQYNPEVVYTQPPQTTTVVVQEDDNTDEVVAAGLIGFTAGIAIGASMNNNYYYGPYGYGGAAYMYNEAWDDYYDHREDAREDWMDHREDVMENRGDVARDRQDQVTERRQTGQDERTNRQQNRAETRPEGTQQRAATQRTQSSAATASAATRTQRAERQGSPEARGYSGTGGQSVQQRSSSGAFSGYSSGASQRSASTRGQRSMSGSRSSGGGGRRR